jgi:hypothetical protein
VKLNLVVAPSSSSKLIQHLREYELKARAESKKVTGAMQTPPSSS